MKEVERSNLPIEVAASAYRSFLVLWAKCCIVAAHFILSLADSIEKHCTTRGSSIKGYSPKMVPPHLQHHFVSVTPQSKKRVLIARSDMMTEPPFLIVLIEETANLFADITLSAWQLVACCLSNIALGAWQIFVTIVLLVDWGIHAILQLKFVECLLESPSNWQNRYLAQISHQTSFMEAFMCTRRNTRTTTTTTRQKRHHR